MVERKNKLIQKVTDLDLTPSNIERNFLFPKEDSWESSSLWDDFLEGANIHLGKRSGGWKCKMYHPENSYNKRTYLIVYYKIMGWNRSFIG